MHHPASAAADFPGAGISAISEKFQRLADYLEWPAHTPLPDALEVATSAEPGRCGAQLSSRVIADRDKGRALFEYLMTHGFIIDWREADTIRIAPVPLAVQPVRGLFRICRSRMGVAVRKLIWPRVAERLPPTQAVRHASDKWTFTLTLSTQECNRSQVLTIFLPIDPGAPSKKQSPLPGIACFKGR